MLSVFSQIKSNFKLKPATISIDNWVFQLHYRITTLILLVATVLVTSRQYIGEHIKCISDTAVPTHVMNTYCFFTTTFTVVADYDEELVNSGNVAHPGVGNYGLNSTAPTQRHAYYQWVPFVLFGQAIMFHLTHLLWKSLEKNRIRKLIDGLQLAAFALEEKELQISGKTVPSKSKKLEYMKLIKNAFIERVYINRSWSAGLIFCEFLNVFNVFLQIYITNVFLDGHFLRLGTETMRDGLESRVTVLEEVFPKVTKCTFHKYGASGSIQYHDAMCVMALNIINEKIYLFLWFWYAFLAAMTMLGLLWRFMTVILHARSTVFNQMVFANSCPGKLNPWRLLTVTKHCNFTDWLFLKYISKNMDGMVFKELLLSLAEDMGEKQPLVHSDDDIVSNKFPN